MNNARKITLTLIAALVVSLAGVSHSEAKRVFKKAKYMGKAHYGLFRPCPKGSFYDKGSIRFPDGACWKCPKGYKRSVYPVENTKACFRRT